MRTCIVRCKHCGKEYSYQASGDGCFDKLNNKDYCPECMKAILDALDKIPKRYEWRYNRCERPDEKTIEKFREMKKVFEEEEERKKNDPFNISFVKCYAGGFLDDVLSAARFTHEWITYIVHSPSEDIFDENAKWSKIEEYDIIEKRFTGHRWLADTREEYEYIPVRHWLKQEDITVCQMEPPLSVMPFMDLIYKH